MEDPTSACVVTVEVDGRQKYLFETDKLAEMLGASRLMDVTRHKAEKCFESNHFHLFSPVSGEIRAWALRKHRVELLTQAWKLREWLEERGMANSTAYMETSCHHFENDNGSLAKVHHDLGEAVRKAKEAKSGVDALPTCSLFAPCRLHGLEPANLWRPDLPERMGLRRKLVSARAHRKFEFWKNSKEKFYREELLEPVRWRVKELTGVDVQREIKFTDLSDRTEDSFVAFVCADGDGMGRLMGKLNWNDPKWGDGRKPWQRNAAFVQAYNDCTLAAFRQAVYHVVVDPIDLDRAKKIQQEGNVDLPFLPQLLGGDDLWMVADRTVVVKLATTFSTEFQANIRKNAVIEKAAQLAGEDLNGITMSLGIAFAKAGYPAFAMIESAESLLKTAKKLRKGRIWGRSSVPAEGCMDWHWIESSLNESVEEARKQGWSYRDGEALMLLTSRPWSVTQCGHFTEAARALAKLPRRKREQLESILRLGRIPSELAWEQWWKGLKQQRSVMKEVNEALPPEWKLDGDQLKLKPWRKLGNQDDNTSVYATPLLDLLSWQHVFGWEGMEVVHADGD